MKRLADNPTPLPEGCETVADLRGEWWIAHVKSRNEKAFAFDLARKGVGYYLPMQEKETYSGGRRRRNLYPLFTSYVFFCGTPEDRVKAFETNRVANVLPVEDQDGFVRELTTIESAIAAGERVEIVEQLPVGQRVEVTRGPFAGTIGLVTGNRPWSAITLVIPGMNVGAELKINGDLLELVVEDDSGGGATVGAGSPRAPRSGEDPRSLQAVWTRTH